MNLNELTIKEARKKLDKGEITSLELTKTCLKRIALLDEKIKACLLVDEAGALLAAKEADKRLKQGEKNNLLGIPYLCKDNILTKGLNTTAASRILENYVAPYDATIIAKLKKAGAVLLGKTNLDEFAHGASTENSAFYTTCNPWDLERVPGGSSGGSAAAVAAHMCLFALGSDTGGSIRQPASFCGILGLKPSYGLVSRHGLIAMTSSTDVIGPLTKTAADAALVLEAIAGPDSFDSTLEGLSFKAKDLGKTKIKGLKIGWPEEYFNHPKLNPEIKNKLEALANNLKKQGAKIIKIKLPISLYGVPVYYIITPSELSSNLARFDGLRYGAHSKDGVEGLDEIYFKNRAFFGPEAKRRIMLGTYALSSGYYDAYYKKAEKVRLLIKKEFAAAFKKVDVIMTPTSPHTAFKIGEQINDPLAMYLEDVFVTSASLAGLPAVSVPAGFLGHLPFACQFIGPRFLDQRVLAVASACEEWNEKRIINL